jgi:hypothetical protein
MHLGYYGKYSWEGIEKMRTLAEYLSAFALTSAVLCGIGYIYQGYGAAWAVASFFVIWFIGPIIPLFALIKDGNWSLVLWVYLPAVLAVLALLVAILAAKLAADKD